MSPWRGFHQKSHGIKDVKMNQLSAWQQRHQLVELKGINFPRTTFAIETTNLFWLLSNRSFKRSKGQISAVLSMLITMWESSSKPSAALELTDVSYRWLPQGDFPAMWLEYHEYHVCSPLFMEPKAGWTVTAGLGSCDIGLIRRWDERKVRTHTQIEDIQSCFALIVGADAAPYGFPSWLLIL